MRLNRKQEKRNELIAIDLFSGCGGLTVGLKKAGFKVRAAVEIDTKAQEVYKLNHDRVKLYEGDIRKLQAETVLSDLKIRRGDIDLLAGCPPCQGFSRLRTRNRRTSKADKRNSLIYEFMRFVRVMNPKTIILENVPALEDNFRFKAMCEELGQMKYKYVVSVLNAADYAVPQRRKRLILIASRVHTPAIAPKNKRRVTVREAFKAIKRSSKTNDALHALPENRSQQVREMIKLIPHDGGSRSDLPEKFKLECHKRINGFHDIYGRLAWDSVAPTITSGCINPSKGRFLHPRQNRTISLREAAILQGFPSKYKFNVAHGKGAIALMIGNALPPPLIAAQARVIHNEIIRNGKSKKMSCRK